MHRGQLAALPIHSKSAIEIAWAASNITPKMVLPKSTRNIRHWRHFLLLASCNLLVRVAICSPNDLASSSSTHTTHALFGVRGGAFFGFGRSSKCQDKENSGGDGDGDAPKPFPALSQDEIEEKLNIPVFGLTDAQGNGVILAESGSNNNIFHLFFSKHMADAALKAVVEANSGAPPLKVSAFHLGKCWFKLIDTSGSRMYTLHKYSKEPQQDGVGSAEEITKAVHFRLVPNAKDLMGARILTGLTPVDVEQLKDAVMEPNPPKALSIIQSAANSATSSFKSPFDQIPVFAIAQMRVRKKDEQGNSVGNNMVPFHLSTKTMSETWNEFIHQSPQFQDAEATLQLIELHKMVEMMQSESDFDFRNIVFIYPQYDKDSKDDSDDDNDESDDGGGGGGDNGMKANDTANFDIEPFYSMEVFASTPDQSLVQI
ncbi:hypothetical protein ACHAXH_007077 [Discostella pseudostelligera]